MDCLKNGVPLKTQGIHLPYQTAFPIFRHSHIDPPNTTQKMQKMLRTKKYRVNHLICGYLEGLGSFIIPQTIRFMGPLLPQGQACATCPVGSAVDDPCIEHGTCSIATL